MIEFLSDKYPKQVEIKTNECLMKEWYLGCDTCSNDQPLPLETLSNLVIHRKTWGSNSIEN